MNPWNGLFLVVLFLASIVIGMVKIADVVAERRDLARQERYEACLTRTTPAVCELHLVRFPSAESSQGGQGIVISPDGRVGVGIGF